MALLATTAMLADRLGVEPETLHKWKQRYADFPEAKFPGSGIFEVEPFMRWCAKRGLPKKQGGSDA